MHFGINQRNLHSLQVMSDAVWIKHLGNTCTVAEKACPFTAAHLFNIRPMKLRNRSVGKFEVS